MRAIVYHASYGCDTGCCGHVVELEDGREEFTFDHPFVPPLQDMTDGGYEWARALGREKFGEEHVADLDWSRCVISDD